MSLLSSSRAPTLVFWGTVARGSSKLLMKAAAGFIASFHSKVFGPLQSLAYEYAKLGARLSIVARREEKLEDVAERCRLAANVHQALGFLFVSSDN